jgi:hypothetical protein
MTFMKLLKSKNEFAGKSIKLSEWAKIQIKIAMAER